MQALDDVAAEALVVLVVEQEAADLQAQRHRVVVAGDEEDLGGAARGGVAAEGGGLAGELDGARRGDPARDVEREVAAIGGDIRVVSFDSLLMDFAERERATMIVRGLRAVADFEYEYQMAGMNQQLNDRIETVFLMADVCLQPIASRLVKEIAIFGGHIGKFVSPAVCAEVVARVERDGRRGS